MPNSWKPMVKTGTDPKFYGNALRFATEDEANRSAKDLMNRWYAVVECKAEPSDDPVNYTYTLDGKLIATDGEKF
jgi:poly(3-hydroxybutyrate) depolymerase